MCKSEPVCIVSLQENPDDPRLAKGRAIISQEEDDNSYINDPNHTGTLIINTIISIRITIIIIIMLQINIITIIIKRKQNLNHTNRKKRLCKLKK